MISSLKTLIRHQGDVFLVNMKIPVSYFTKNGIVNEKAMHVWREELKSNAIIKVQEYFLFCEKIEDIEIITEEQPKIENNDNSNSNLIDSSPVSTDISSRTNNKSKSNKRGSRSSSKGRRKSSPVSKRPSKTKSSGDSSHTINS